MVCVWGSRSSVSELLKGIHVKQAKLTFNYFESIVVGSSNTDLKRTMNHFGVLVRGPTHNKTYIL